MTLTQQEHNFLDTILRMDSGTIESNLLNLIDLEVSVGSYSLGNETVEQCVNRLLTNAPQFVTQMVHIEYIENLTGVTILWGGFYDSLLTNLGYQPMVEMGQGLNKKMFKLLDRFFKTGIQSVTIPNTFKSEAHGWTGSEITLINESDLRQVFQLVRDIEVNGLEVV